MAQQVVLTTGCLGGVGDHLIYSSLPERFAKLGFEVYLDKDNLTRNGDSHDLIWGKNPYILGTSDKKPTIGYVNQGKFYDIANRFPLNSIEAMERAHGLLPPYNMAPKIYYDPQPPKIDLSQAVLADFNAISSRIKPQGVADMVARMNERFPGKQFYLVRFPNTIASPAQEFEGPSLTFNTIYEYVDALKACYGWIGTEAGGQALAAAVRGEHDVYDLSVHPECICIITPKTFNSRGYTFRGIDYRVTTHGEYAGDYWEPEECRYERYQLMCRRTVEEARAAWEAARG